MRRVNYLGLVTLKSFGWDDKPRSSVCTYSEHQVRTTKILRSLCVSHKIVETYRYQHALKFSKGKMEWCANGSNDQSHLRVWHLRRGLNIGQAPWAFDRMDMCAMKVFNQSINQFIGQQWQLKQFALRWLSACIINSALSASLTSNNCLPLTQSLLL
jgi:hypothetical protein